MRFWSEFYLGKCLLFSAFVVVCENNLKYIKSLDLG